MQNLRCMLYRTFVTAMSEQVTAVIRHAPAIFPGRRAKDLVELTFPTHASTDTVDRTLHGYVAILRPRLLATELIKDL